MASVPPPVQPMPGSEPTTAPPEFTPAAPDVDIPDTGAPSTMPGVANPV